MESFSVGTLAGAGSFDCDSCGFTLALQELDEVPTCPECGGSEFRRSSMFDHGVVAAIGPVGEDEGQTHWLREAREALVRAGDYLAYRGRDRVHVVPLQDGWTRIGRSLSAHVRFDDPTVSRRHALMFRDDSGAKILDDRSLNGVFVNGDRVELERLDDGDEIAIGRFRLHFVRVTSETSERPQADVGSAVG